MSLKGVELQAVGSANEWVPRYLDVVAVIFVTALLVSNVAAVKLFQFGPAVFTCGILVFPISYIFGDVLTEVYGYSRTRRVIYLGLFANVFLVAVLTISVALPPAEGWPLQDAFAAVHQMVPRIVVASIVAYWAGELVNSYVMSKIKVVMNARKLWIRTVSSTVVGQLVDTSIFALIAFVGVLPVSTLVATVISAWIFKVVYEAAATPITYAVVGKLKSLEGIEHFDRNERYNPFKL